MVAGSQNLNSHGVDATQSRMRGGFVNKHEWGRAREKKKSEPKWIKRGTSTGFFPCAIDADSCVEGANAAKMRTHID